jgi:hypothetical protein
MMSKGLIGTWKERDKVSGAAKIAGKENAKESVTVDD